MNMYFLVLGLVVRKVEGREGFVFDVTGGKHMHL